jgi:hypothetical protein
MSNKETNLDTKEVVEHSDADIQIECPYTLPKPYLSASQINMYLRCGKQYYFRYILGISSPPAIAMTMGSAVHETYEPMYQDVIEGKGLWKPEVAQEYSVFQLEAKAEEDDLPLRGREKDEAVSVVRNVVGSYSTFVAPYVKPLGVEIELRETLPCGVPILGYIDLVRGPTDLEEEKGFDYKRIVDYKVTKSKWPENKLPNDFQFNLYAALTAIKDVEIHNSSKSTKPFKQAKTTEADYFAAKQDVATNLRILRHKFPKNCGVHVNNLVESVASGISKGAFPLAPMDSWCCNETFCGYYHLCRGKC